MYTVYSPSSPKNLLPFLQKLCFCFHRDGHDGVLTPQAQVASRTLVLLSCIHAQLLFNSLGCIKISKSSKHHPIHTNHSLLTRPVTVLENIQKQTVGFVGQKKKKRQHLLCKGNKRVCFSYVQYTLSGTTTARWKPFTMQTFYQHTGFCTFSI